MLNMDQVVLMHLGVIEVLRLQHGAAQPHSPHLRQIEFIRPALARGFAVAKL